MGSKGVEMSAGPRGKRMLLLGAGFSKNWGGRLAKEVWADVFTSKAVQVRERVRQALLKERSFEAVMEDVLTGKTYDSEDRKAIIDAVTGTFRRMDELYSQNMITVTSRRINYYTLISFLSKFSGSVLFTLNQDTLIEKLLQLHHHIRFDTPNVPPHNQVSDEGPVLPILPNSEGITFIKLHGSYNWATSDGTPVMVIGINKSAQISGSWLLTKYRNTFQAELKTGGVKLFVAGYSFSDEHVNESIAMAVKQYQCKIFIWDPVHPLDSLKGPTCQDILNGLIGWEPRLIDEVMPTKGVIQLAEEPNQIFPTFFD
jgi:SIR2-like domain